MSNTYPTMPDVSGEAMITTEQGRIVQEFPLIRGVNKLAEEVAIERGSEVFKTKVTRDYQGGVVSSEAIRDSYQHYASDLVEQGKFATMPNQGEFYSTKYSIEERFDANCGVYHCVIVEVFPLQTEKYYGPEDYTRPTYSEDLEPESVYVIKPNLYSDSGAPDYDNLVFVYRKHEGEAMRKCSRLTKNMINALWQDFKTLEDYRKAEESFSQSEFDTTNDS